MKRSFLALLAAVLAAPLPAFAAEPISPSLDLAGLPETWSPFLGVSAAAETVETHREARRVVGGDAVGLMRGPIAGNGRWGLEGGYLRTSDDEKALYLGATAEWRVVEFGRGAEGRLGVFVAYAEYPRLVDAADDLGVMTLGDFVPLVAAQASVRVGDNLSLVSRAGPAMEDGRIVVGFEAVYVF